MPRYAVENDDGRVFEVEATTADEAVALVARARNLRPAGLRAAPPPRRQRELGMPLFWGAIGLLAAFVAWALLG